MPARTLLLALGLGAAACGNADATPAGTEVLRWSADGKTSLSDVTVIVPPDGTRAKEMTITTTPNGGGGPTIYAVHVELADLATSSRPTPNAEVAPKVTAPVTITARVIDSGGWTITSRCEPTLLVGMPAMKDTKLVTSGPLFQRCDLIQKIGADKTNVLVLEIDGDGKLTKTFLGGTVSVAE